ncbi:uncharacterized protein EDB91DRAFT_1088352 [Suillus paluster]|uniref:uncharacterized protein n=1 Tax=Suillus paluster TaxID=48578 RepID=UPI001B87EB34|nr:uncharacterized protein EDB91DRAFT_1088352 [Suillus paluster]KAG1721782.1 hypothetical protein EDB91DRAFT_1088352 [Suillus paluster]
MLCFMHNIALALLFQLDKFLGHDTENWHMLNSCPACQYKLVNEPTLDFLILCACDGNNSAKLVDPAVRSGEECLDPRSGLSSIWLTKLYIDQFKDEVQSAWAHQARQQPSDPDDLWIDELDSNDSAEPPTICVDCWCNAAPKSCKKMFAIFKKSGIFVTVCQHGMKYPIASVKKPMDVFGSDIFYGYDIKCTFEKIIQWSSLADDAKYLNLQGVVPAFHRHAHNHLCQVEHHSKYKVGAGKEDFETYSMLTLNVADFIYNNYVQALTIISMTNVFLANFHTSNAAIKPNFEDNLKDEHQVLQCLARKKEESTVEVDYVKALNEYDEAHGLDLRLNYSTKESGDIRCHHLHATNKCDQKLEIVTNYEHQMALDSIWGPDHPEQMKAQSHITNWLFHKAVDDIECLVVMRLLELTKLQMSGLGYKLRTQISKETDGEIQLKSWANPSYQHASTQYFEHQCANEEIRRLNVEVGHLLMKMRDDAIDYPHAITQLQSNDPPLAAELQHRWTQLWSINACHIWRIQQIMQLPGYSGPKSPGSRDREEGDRDDTELGQQLEDI